MFNSVFICPCVWMLCNRVKLRRIIGFFAWSDTLSEVKFGYLKLIQRHGRFFLSESQRNIKCLKIAFLKFPELLFNNGIA